MENILSRNHYSLCRHFIRADSCKRENTLMTKQQNSTGASTICQRARSNAGVFLVFLLLAGAGWGSGQAHGSVYYLDNTATGSGDGLSAENAFTDLDTCNTAVRGGENTVIVYEGDGSPYGPLLDTGDRSVWLTYQAASGESPKFQSIALAAGSAKNWYFRFDGIAFAGEYYNKDANVNAHLYLQNASYVDVLNCRFEGGGWTEGISDPLKQGIALAVGTITNINVIDCQFVGVATGAETIVGYYHAIYSNVAMSAVLIEGCTITDSHYSLALMGSFTVRNCTATGWTSDAVFIRGAADGVVIEDCNFHGGTELLSAHNDCIQVGDNAISNVTIRRNKLYDSERQLLYINPASGDGYLVENNVCYSANAPTGSQNSYPVTIGANVGGIKFNNNTVVNGADTQGNAGTVYVVDGAVITEMGNNIIERLVASAAVAAVANENYNIISAKVNITGVGANSQELTTENFQGMFVNYAGLDFQLIAGAEAINTGSATYAPATDILGTARPQGAADDIGAYEYVDSATPAAVFNRFGGLRFGTGKFGDRGRF